MMRDLSVIIPARNEVFLKNTIENILMNLRADTEIIAILDGYWPTPVIYDHPRVVIVHHTESIGQRAATNEGARISQAKYVMKIDAHCAVDEGFDVKLMEDCQPNWTMVPSMYNLHAFDWMCDNCGEVVYQGSQPQKCEKCGKSEFTMQVLWGPRKNKLTISWRFDKNLQFKYWRAHGKRQESQGDIVETMCCNGACMFLERERYWELGGMDEAHGSWGQFGVELACKAWLSGGKLVTSRKTWFAHMFRTGNFSRNGESSWPYPISQKQVEHARAYSRDLWMNNKWPGAKYPLQWLIDHFAPVPDWHEAEAA